MTDIDERLREYAARWRAAQPPTLETSAPDLERPRPRGLALALAAAALVAGAAVAAVVVLQSDDTTVRTGNNDEPKSGVVPWVDKPATIPTTTTMPVTAVEICRPESLELGTIHEGAAAGSTGRSVPMTNQGSTTCSLPDGAVRLTAVDDAGQRVTLRTDVQFAPNGIVLAPGQSGSLLILSGNTCDGEGRVLPTRHYRAVELGLGSAAIPLGGVELVLCTDQVSAGFQLEPPPAGAVPGTVATLTVRIEAPSTAKAGDTLRYTVVLSNPTDIDVPFDSCPAYTESIFVVDTRVMTRRTLQLNCATVHTINAHTEVTYEMVISVPIGAGEAKFNWMLEPDGPGGGVPLTIVR